MSFMFWSLLTSLVRVCLLCFWYNPGWVFKVFSAICPSGALTFDVGSPTLAFVCFFILILSRFLWVTGNHISQSVTSGCNLVELPCRKLVPVGSIAVDKSLVAGIEVCLQNKLPIIKA